MNATRIQAVAVVGIAVIGIALAGCTTKAPETDPTTGPGTTQTDPTTETAEPEEPVVEFGVGDTVTNEGGSFIADLQKGLPPGLHLIRLGDTLEYLVVDEHQPLPAEVLDPVVAQIKAGYPAPGVPYGDALTQAGATVGDLETSAGKCVVLYYGPVTGAGTYVPSMADPQSQLASNQPLYREFVEVALANRPKSLDAMIAQFTPFAERAGCTADRLVFIQFAN